MLDLFIAYGFFLLKAITIALAVLIPILIIINSSRQKNLQDKGQLTVKNLSKRYENMGTSLKGSQMNSKDYKKLIKQKNKEDKKQKKKLVKQKQSIYVLNFMGDTMASEVDKLKQEINAILASKTNCKEVVLKVESGGGAAYAYGLCAAELKRLVDNKIKLTVCIDKVAASGGYLMSCVASKIIAAPWAVVGSIGVIAQLPNVHRLLKENKIDFEMHTAGEFKRTLTMFGENTEEGRKKFISELEDLHAVFKDFVQENRPNINTKEVSTGEVWQGKKALEVGLIDDIKTSDDYLLKLSEKFNLYEIEYLEKKPLADRFAFAAQMLVDKTLMKVQDTLNKDRYIR
jgi:serine protease SohB